MQLDGSTVNVGDVVYDIVSRQTHRVQRVNQSSFICGTETRPVVVQEGGFIGKVKRFYWYDPVIFIPKKSDLEKTEKLKAISEIL